MSLPLSSSRTHSRHILKREVLANKLWDVIVEGDGAAVEFLSSHGLCRVSVHGCDASESGLGG